MKKFKKLIITILSFVLVFSSSFFITACGDRSATLKIYVPGEYVDSDTISGFETWYKQQTGKTIKVEKQEFETCETMYTQIALKKVDYDIICPSDYMVERMINEGLLFKLNSNTKDIVNIAVSGENNENADFVNLIKNSYDANLEYSAPYMWGTMGIMYYYNGVEEAISADITTADSQKSSWSSIFEGSDKKIYMKDAERDSYTAALLYAYRDDLNDAIEDYGINSPEYKEILNKVFVKGDDFNSKLNVAKTKLSAQKSLVYDYETDEGKMELKLNKGAEGYYGMFWSCDAGYIMFGEDDEDYNTNFRYLVPEEGSNVWIDNFCIPKYAGNSSAANMFIQYMMDSEVAFNCMDFTGCTSGVYQATLDYYDYLNPTSTAGLSEDDYDVLFYEKSDAFKAMYLSLMFPNRDITIGDFTFESVINRCGIMRDLGAQGNDALTEMWSDVRR